MNGTLLLARRYAQAFMNIHADDINKETFDYMRQTVSFFKQHKRALFFLELPYITDAQKQSILHQVLIQQCRLPKVFDALITQLIEHKRSFLIAEVLEQIVAIYLKLHNIEQFLITSSHELTKAQLNEIQRYLADRLGKDIIYEYKIDKNLIAGIRLLSDYHVWEYSIAQQLHRVRLPLLA